RAANDVGQINAMIVPGLSLTVNAWMGLVVPIVFIGLLNWHLLLAPFVFTVAFVVVLRRYLRTFQPVANAMRAQFGVLNAGLNETVTGIDVVKATAEESFEQRRFGENAGRYRDLFVRNGQIQARYLPPLLLAVAMAGAFVLGLYLVSHHVLPSGRQVSYMGLIGL